MTTTSFLFRLAMALLCAAPLLGFSQGDNNVIQNLPPVPSANAQNLGLYGEVPVSFNSGVPSVSIPLYEIKARGFTVPVTLDYHASGFRPELHPSWAGMGWSLNTGGSITRVVKGYEDEACYNIKGGYYETYAVNNVSNWNDPSYLNQYRYPDFQKDMEPDEFKFSFPGHSGEFFLDEYRNWHVRCDEPVKVIFDGTWTIPFPNTTGATPTQISCQTFRRFTIIDEKGNQYIFGNLDSSSDDNIEYSTALINDDGASTVATAWNLKQIISADGYDVVTYTYVRGPYQAELFNSIAVENSCGSYTTPTFQVGGKLISPVYLTNISYNKTGLNISFGSDKSTELAYTDADWNNLFNSTGIHSLTTQLSHLSQIPYFNNHSVDPAADIPGVGALTWFRLNLIDVTGPGFEKSILFNYTNAAAERLKLGSINIKPSYRVQSPAQNYIFDYYNNFSLPAYLTNISDSWGYYNDFQVAYNSAYGSNFSYYKQPTADLAHAVNGTLKTITYPTGGSSLFEYEQHQFAQSIDPNTRLTYSFTGTAGGIRIKDIKTNDNNGNQEIKNYYYVNNYTAAGNPGTLTSSGILETAPRYSYSGTLVDQASNAFSFTYYSSNPVIPATSASTGQHVSYSQVAEQRSDGAYTIYKYTDQNSNPDNAVAAMQNAAMLPALPYSPKDFERGKLLGKYVYDKNDHPVESEEYQYPSAAGTGLELYRVPNVQSKYKNGCTGSATETASNREPYYLYYYNFKPSAVTYKTYGNPSSASVVTKTKTYVYNSSGLPQTEDLVNSDGTDVKTTYKYAWEVSNQLMGQKNMIDFKGEIDVAKNQTPVRTQKITYSDYPDAPGNFYPATVTEKAGTNDPEVTVVSIDAYDQGNVKQQTLKGGTVESFQWGYGKAYPIAKVTNAHNNVTTAVQAQTITGRISTQAGYPVTFTTYQTGDITLSITLTSPPTIGFSVTTNLNGPVVQNISLCFAYASYTCGPNSPSTITYPNMPAGTYTLTEYANAVVFADISYTYVGSQQTTTGSNEFYFQNYEEGGGGTPGNAHTGTSFYNGSTCYVGWTPPNNRSYVYSYWYLNNGVWSYSGELPYLNSYVQLTGGTGFDDVRIYPKDAQMTTYTYIPDVGVSSVTDAKGLTTYYEYDSFSRLMNIKDKDGNIVNHVDYHYQGQ